MSNNFMISYILVIIESWAINSGVECLGDIEEAIGSNPISPTIENRVNYE